MIMKMKKIINNIYIYVKNKDPTKVEIFVFLNPSIILNTNPCNKTKSKQ